MQLTGCNAFYHIARFRSDLFKNKIKYELFVYSDINITET